MFRDRCPRQDADADTGVAPVALWGWLMPPRCASRKKDCSSSLKTYIVCPRFETAHRLTAIFVVHHLQLLPKLTGSLSSFASCRGIYQQETTHARHQSALSVDSPPPVMLWRTHPTSSRELFVLCSRARLVQAPDCSFKPGTERIPD